MFYNIFLKIFCFILVILNLYAYESGINKVSRSIKYDLTIEDSLAITIENDNLNFGEILRGSTGLYFAEGKIKIEAGLETKYINAYYRSGSLESDGKTKLQIKFNENIEENKKLKKDIKTTEEEMNDTLDVYMYPLDEKYVLKEKENINMTEIEIKGEIREVSENSKLGIYDGVMVVEIIAINESE